MSFDELALLAAAAGYSSICMRASQAGIQTDHAERKRIRRVLDENGLTVSMVTGDHDIAWNNDNAAAALRNIEPYLDLAEDFGTTLIRVGMKSEDDVVWAQRASDIARERGISLAHQSHTETLFETVEGSVDTLKRVNRENFGIIYEPANLHICGQDYGLTTIQRFAPWLMNVYLQNLRINPDGALKIRTWIHGEVVFNSLPFGDHGGIDFPLVFDGLAKVGYEGHVTVHHNIAENMSPADGIKQFHNYLTSISRFESPIR